MVLGRFDKYLLQKLLLLFGFFSLILVLVFWVNKAVSLLDSLLGDGQAASTFLTLTILGLPSIITSVLPITAFIAVVFGINQMTSDSELVIVRATGFSPWRLGRPVIVFGILCAVMMGTLTHVLVPLSLKELSIRQSEITRDVTARFLIEGQFLHPSDGITFYVRETSPNGELLDVFLSDTRTNMTRKTYMAKRALLTQDDLGPVLLMFDGAAQDYNVENQLLGLTTFESFAYGLDSLSDTAPLNTRRLSSIPTFELLFAPEVVMSEIRKNKVDLREEIHDRMGKALLALVAPMLGFAALIAGGFSRFGSWRYIFVAFGLLIFIKALDSAVAAHMKLNPQDWGLFYVPHIVALSLYVVWLFFASKPKILRILQPRPQNLNLQNALSTNRGEK